MLFSRGPRLSKASIRSKYWRTSSTEVTSPRSIACWSSGIVWPRASKRSPCIVSAAASARMVSTVMRLLPYGSLLGTRTRAMPLSSSRSSSSGSVVSVSSARSSATRASSSRTRRWRPGGVLDSAIETVHEALRAVGAVRECSGGFGELVEPKLVFILVLILVLGLTDGFHEGLELVLDLFRPL